MRINLLLTVIITISYSLVTSNICSQTIVFAELTGSPNVNTTGWNLTGAAQSGDTGGDSDGFTDEIILTPNVFATSGGIFFDQPIDLSACPKWKVQFDFRMWQGNAADGIAFCFLDTPPSGFVNGGGVGIPASSNGIFVILDTYDNGCGNNPEIQIYKGTAYDECGSGIISRVQDLNFLRSNDYQNCMIEYLNGTINVFINGTQYLTGAVTGNLSGYMGFTASTGGSRDMHSIRNVKMFADIAVVNAGPDITICDGETVQIGAADIPAYKYNWSGGPNLSSDSISGPSVSPTNSTNAPITYTYTVQAELTGMPESCPGFDTVLVTVNPSPSVNAGPDQTICIGQSVVLSASGADAYIWNNGIENGVSFIPENSGSYVVSATNSIGCLNTDSVNIVLTPCSDFISNLPNIFTPNGDGSNDVFFVPTEGAESIKVTILNRWGNVIIEYEDINGKWDGTVSGKEAPEGVYFFKYLIKGLDGTEISGHGNITLSR